MFGFNPYYELLGEIGSEENWLFGLIKMHLATPEELEKYRELVRPKYEKYYERILKREVESLVEQYRDNACYSRKRLDGLEMANRRELQADALERGVLKPGEELGLKGYVGEER